MINVWRFMREDDGVDMLEYALLVGLLSLACLGIVGTTGETIGTMFQKLSGKLTQVLP
jgi:Flp pilus assembly pilin Flp